MKQSSTCLAVIRGPSKRGKKGPLIFAADRRCSWGHIKHQVSVRSKITKRDGIIFAGTGSAYLCDIINELSNVPKNLNKLDPFNFVHNELYPSIMNKLREKHLLNDDGTFRSGDKNELHSAILIGYQGELFEMELSDFLICVDPIDTEYAHGCGGYYALGSLSTTKFDTLKILRDRLKKMKIKQIPNDVEECRLILALNIAAEHSSGCDNNIDIVREDR